MPRDVGIGLVGLGWMGQVHSRAYRRLRDHFPETALRPRLVVAADTSDERRQQAVDVHGYAEVTDDWRAVVAHPEVEAVSITAPNFLHRDVAVACAEAGRHVWLEKPCGRVPAETAEIAAAVRRAGVASTVGFNYRWAPAVQHARELIAGGAIGAPTHYRSTFLADYASDPRGGRSWRFQRAYGGLGVLGDLMTHAVDLAHALLGPIEALAAEQAVFVAERPAVGLDASHFASGHGGDLAAVENEDYATALVRFASGARGTLEASRVVTGPHARYAFEVHGSEGALAWDFARMDALERFDRGQGDAGYRTVRAGPGTGDFGRFQPSAGIAMGYDDLKVIEAQRFLHAVATGEPCEADLDAAAAAMAVCAAMQRAVAERAWVPVTSTDELAAAAAAPREVSR